MHPRTAKTPVYLLIADELHPKDKERLAREESRRVSIRSTHIYTFQYHDGLNYTKKTFQALQNPKSKRWFSWPTLLEFEEAVSKEMSYSLEYHRRVARYGEKTGVTTSAKGPATRCTYCHDELASSEIICKCNSVIHYSCAAEIGGQCITPGCDKAVKERVPA